MHLIQLFLPLHDNNKQVFPSSYFNGVWEDLTNRFGGVTTFVRSPAVGLWKENSDDIDRDEIFTFEVLTDQLDEDWWAGYRKQLEDKFRQEELLILVSNITKL